MSLHSQPISPIDARERLRHPICVKAHPGGRFPGVELPPTWFNNWQQLQAIASALPEPGNAGAIVDGVISMCTELRDVATSVFEAGEHPVLIGGDHSLAMGSLAAAARFHERVAVIWVDAHADFNTMESSPSGNPHGMPLAASCGIGAERITRMFSHFVSPQDVVLIGARDIDPGERMLLMQYNIWCVSIEQFRELGPQALVNSIARRFDGLPVHLSFDFDAISSDFFSATGTPVPNGLTPDEGCELLKALASSSLDIRSSDWVEFDPRPAQAEESAKVARQLYQAFHGLSPTTHLAP